LQLSFFFKNVPELCIIEQCCTQFFLAVVGDSHHQEEIPVVIDEEEPSHMDQGTNELQQLSSMADERAADDASPSAAAEGE
jgi:hypothetical protein